MLHSYPSIFAIGHKAIRDIFEEEVQIEEKVDGSQFSFGRLKDETGHYDLLCKSKGKMQNVHGPDSLFDKAIETVKSLESALHVDWVYRGEYLKSPKHNALKYNRTPEANIIIFDINIGNENYLTYEEKKDEATRLGLEVVPLIYKGKVNNSEEIYKMLDRESVLGGTKIEGVVIKNYLRYGQDKKILIAKYVSEAFKEVHTKEWNKANPASKDIIETIVEKYRTEARWNKAIQHLKENGELENTPKDIGKLLGEIHKDIEKECLEDIKNTLYRWAKDKIYRGFQRGFPEHYKKYLLESQFKNKEEK